MILFFSAHHLMVVYISTKFNEISGNFKGSMHIA